jgi:hypothetical protein
VTEPAADATLTPLDLLATQNETIETLTRGLEFLQIEVEALRRRVQALEGVPWPDEEPPGE